jgi:hypothetical protein
MSANALETKKKAGSTTVRNNPIFIYKITPLQSSWHSTSSLLDGRPLQIRGPVADKTAFFHMSYFWITP